MYPNLSKQGVFTGSLFNEMGMRFRYLRDTINGSTANAGNHWNEIKIINDVGENIALAHSVKIGTTTYTNSVITDGVVNSSYLSGGTNIVLDLGYVATVYQVIIWHYYSDGRTYHDNVTEVSLDGTNWIEIYRGEKPETSAGNVINLHPLYMSITDAGEVICNEIIEW